MDFADVLNAKTADERKEIIQRKLEDEFWGEYLDNLEHGGMAEDTEVNDLKIVDDPNSLEIVAYFRIDFNESVATSCGDCNANYSGFADMTLRIDRESVEGEIEIDNVDVDDEVYISNGDYL